MTEERFNHGHLHAENRQLKKTVHTLLDELEQAQGVAIDAQAVRETLPAVVAEEEEIDPPWERGGHDSKEAWMNDKNSGNPGE
jgi:hypothetical protein